VAPAPTAPTPSPSPGPAQGQGASDGPASASAPPNPAKPASPPIGLISLERPFDPDEFAELLGQTSITVNVPRESLSEVLKRVSDFMGFGIYVYSIRVRPAPEEMLHRFVVELERVDFSPSKGDWVRFEDKGRSDSPFGPTGGRR
jgi:hypothetical protein